MASAGVEPASAVVHQDGQDQVERMQYSAFWIAILR